MTTRSSDHGRVRAWWGRWGRDLTTLAAVGIALWSVLVTQANVDDLAHESAQRRDQTCTLFESKEQGDVDQLARTYKYLADLSARQLAEPLNRAILAQLPRVVRDAETPDAPPYCNAPGVGLPEPAPGLPKRPAGLPHR